MNDTNRAPSIIEYEMRITFKKDNVIVTFTGDKVIFHPDSAEIRPKHLRIISAVHDLMKDYYQSNREPK